MRFKRHLTLEKGQLDIVPLIDVVFLLLIFFMLTSSFVSYPGIKINLPKALSSGAVLEKNLVITIIDKDTIYLNDEIVNTEDLSQRIKKAADNNRSVLIKSDRGIPLGKIVEIWDICRSSGVVTINIATTQEK